MSCEVLIKSTHFRHEINWPPVEISSGSTDFNKPMYTQYCLLYQCVLYIVCQGLNLQDLLATV